MPLRFTGFCLKDQTIFETITVTFAQLLFSIATTAYILLAIGFEETDLVCEHRQAYEEYRRSVPKLIPFLVKRGPVESHGLQKINEDTKESLLSEEGEVIGHSLTQNTKGWLSLQCISGPNQAIVFFQTD